MANITGKVTLPKPDTSKSVETEALTGYKLNGNTVRINRAFKNANNSLFLIVTGAATLTIQAGDNYPNACLGDLPIELDGTVDTVIIEDISRFENRDGSIILTGTKKAEADAMVYPVAKRTGLEDAVNQEDIEADTGYQTGFVIEAVENPDRVDTRAISGNVNA